MKYQINRAGVKQMVYKIFHRRPNTSVTVGMDQVKATMESGFGALLDFLD
jgi:beta-galactosidase